MVTDMDMVKKRKKVLLISGSNKPIPAIEGGAIEKLTEQLVEKNLSSDDNIELTVLSEGRNYFKKIQPNYYYYKKKYNYPKEIIRKIHNQIFFSKQYTNIKNNLLQSVKRLVKENHYDEIIVLNYGIYCIYIRKFYSGKISLFLHNDYLNRKSYKYKEVLNSVDQVISVSEFIEDKVRKIEKKPNIVDLSIVSNGIDLNLFKPEKDATKLSSLRKQLNLRESSIILLYSGRIDPTKGVKQLIRAFKRLGYENTVLLLVGEVSNKYRKDFYHSIRGMESQIKYVSSVAQDELVKIYQLADLCLIPSIVEESFCLVNIEAQACNLPVIATKSGALTKKFYGLKEMHIDNNELNLEANLVKAIQFFINNRIYLSSINYRENAMNYSVNQMYSQFINCVKGESS